MSFANWSYHDTGCVPKPSDNSFRIERLCVIVDVDGRTTLAAVMMPIDISHFVGYSTPRKASPVITHPAPARLEPLIDCRSWAANLKGRTPRSLLRDDRDFAGGFLPVGWWLCWEPGPFGIRRDALHPFLHRCGQTCTVQAM